MTDKERPALEEPAVFTHKATFKVFSNGNDGMVSVRVFFDPPMEGKDFKELGYFPPAFQFMEEFIIPAIEQGWEEWAAGPLYSMESPSQYDN